MQEENFFSIPKRNACHYASAPDGQLCFILALKVCEGVQDIAHNIYTSRLPPQDHCLNGPLGGPEVGREGTTCMCLLTLYVCQLLTDRQRGEPDRPSPFGRCHAQMLRTDLTSTDRAKMRPWSDSSAGPGPRGKKKHMSHGSGERRGRGGVEGGLILHSYV